MNEFKCFDEVINTNLLTHLKVYEIRVVFETNRNTVNSTEFLTEEYYSHYKDFKFFVRNRHYKFNNVRLYDPLKMSYTKMQRNAFVIIDMFDNDACIETATFPSCFEKVDIGNKAVGLYLKDPERLEKSSFIFIKDQNYRIFSLQVQRDF